MLLSQQEVERVLGTDSKGVRRLIQARKLKRHPETGSFLKDQVDALREEIERELRCLHAAEMGQDKPKMGVQHRFREEPNLV